MQSCRQYLCCYWSVRGRNKSSENKIGLKQTESHNYRSCTHTWYFNLKIPMADSFLQSQTIIDIYMWRNSCQIVLMCLVQEQQNTKTSQT